MKKDDAFENLDVPTTDVNSQTEQPVSNPVIDAPDVPTTPEAQDALSEIALEALENSAIAEEPVVPTATEPAVQPVPVAPVPPMEPTTSGEKKKSKLPIILLALVVIAAIAFGVYYFLFQKEMTPEEHYTKILNDGYKSLSKILDSDQTFNLDQPFALTATASVETNMEGLKDLSKLKFQLGIGTDLVKKNFILDLGVAEGTKNILSATAAIDNQDVYLTSKEIFDKTIFVSDAAKDLWTGFDSYFEEAKDALHKLPTGKNLDHIVKLVKDALVENISTSNITSTEEKLTVSGKEESVTKLVYKLDSKEVSKLVTAVINALKGDEASLETITSLSGMGKEDLIDTLDKMLPDEESDQVAYIDLYVKGRKVLKAEIRDDETSLLHYIAEGKLSTITITEDDTEIVKVTIDTTKDTVIHVTTPDELDIKLTVRELTAKKVDADFEVTAEGQTVTGSVTSTVKGDETTASVTIAMDGEQSLKVTLDMTMKINTTISMPSTTDAVNADSLTDADTERYLSNLENAIKGTSLESILEFFMSNSGSTDTDTDIDTDISIDSGL